MISRSILIKDIHTFNNATVKREPVQTNFEAATTTINLIASNWAAEGLRKFFAAHYKNVVLTPEGGNAYSITYGRDAERDKDLAAPTI